MKLNNRQLEILQHALGLDQHGRGVAYRNHFCAGPVDEPACRELVALGLAYVFHQNASPLPYYNIAITPDGRKAVREQSAPAPRLTRSQARYRHYLRVADCFENFGDFLRKCGRAQMDAHASASSD